jgi:tRNA dimethylallyltransferase
MPQPAATSPARMPDRGSGSPIYLAGPTAVGKSAVALLLAEALNGEIISVDSMQVYRGMDIGTAKPSIEERACIPHHLIDVVDITEFFDVARFLELASSAEENIIDRGKTPIFCGGTGLYFKALASGIGSAPPGDAKVRRELELLPLPELLLELQEKDPDTLARIDQNNRRRVVRAVEVMRITGKPFSEMKSDWRGANQKGVWLGLRRTREDLNHRIDERVDIMFKQGLMQETKTLLEQGLERNRTAMQALGYRQVVGLLKGEYDLDHTINLVKQKTRQFAKRQMTWFERQLSLQWVDVTPDEPPNIIFNRVLSLF